MCNFKNFRIELWVHSIDTKIKMITGNINMYVPPYIFLPFMAKAICVYIIMST